MMKAEKKVWMTAPLYLIWEIWKERNIIILKLSISPTQTENYLCVVYMVLGFYDSETRFFVH